jgi:hypothetical protein
LPTCKGKYDKAIVHYEKSLAIYLKNLGPEHPDVATTYFGSERSMSTMATNRRRWRIIKGKGDPLEATRSRPSEYQGLAGLYRLAQVTVGVNRRIESGAKIPRDV